MTLTPAEKQKAYRDRQNEKKRNELKAGGDASSSLLRIPFSEYAQSAANLSDYELPLALIGLEAPAFDDERGPLEFAFEEAIHNVDDPFAGAEGAIGHAEVTIGCLIDAATTLAGVVNRYKQQEIKNRLAELEDPDRTDRATALKEAVKLNKILSQLEKQVRWTFPQWKVMGI